MDSGTPLEINTRSSWRAPSYDMQNATIIGLTHDGITGFGDVNHMSSDDSRLTPYDDFELFESNEMKTFLMDLPKANHGRSSSTRLSTFGGPHSSSTPPRLAKRETAASSGIDSPSPEMYIDISGERRRAQNRTAQRAHRERQKRYVSQLEKRFFALQASYHQLDEKYKTVQRQYESLASLVHSQQTLMDSPMLQDVTEVVLGFSSAEVPPFNEFSWCEQELDRILACRADETPSPE
ncbi:hypothetical protein H2200_012112 [Cladophialophora chaetospira]|uniref:BZIP domain-containing protein n=1 Tax=Cladophialophora chaetospira TaxID=386627 RepID=A0AA39CCK7_9EURO|nr:hypothetical protein H2200_012112 [Cladophialophora chaetospira]